MSEFIRTVGIFCKNELNAIKRVEFNCNPCTRRSQMLGIIRDIIKESNIKDMVKEGKAAYKQAKEDGSIDRAKNAKKCQRCGAEVKEGQKFCSECGTEL